MNIEQRALRFVCAGSSLVGVVDVPERPLERGVLLLADSAQYRVGGHRQFTLLSRMLAPRGVPVMRFDRRGMGDADGEPRAFDAIDDDIRAAMKEFFTQAPEMKESVIIGLGDAALSAALYAPLDPRVCAVVLLNPRPAGHGDDPAPFHHHYLPQLGEVAFWRKAGHERATGPLRRNLLAAAGAGRTAVPRRIADSLAHFGGRAMMVLGGEDLAARDFGRVLQRHHPALRSVEVAQAGHEFASKAWREAVAQATASWITSW
jgi:exosortase A-associated hydrolase 1